MTYIPDPVQRQVIDAHDPVLLVLGGAGTGKTITAAATARVRLERIEQQRTASTATAASRAPQPVPRALFLSFSRSSIAQILDRTADVLGPYQPHVEITTFHAFAWRLLQRWGATIGLKKPQLLSETEAKLFKVDGTVRYKDLLPRALDLCNVPAVREHLQSRWSLIVSDEFQDTDDHQFELLTTIRGGARLLLLGDPNQCIYSTLPDVTGVGPERLTAALALPGARQIDLPDVSHRDPSNVLPAAATRIRRREFDHDAVRAALDSGRLQIHAGLSLDGEADEVSAVVQELIDEKYTVGVFSHHIDATTALSDELTERGVGHEIIGLPECLGAALDAQNAMVQFAGGTASWKRVQQRLAVFVTSSVRGKQVPDLARMLLGQLTPPSTLTQRLDALHTSLQRDEPADAAAHAAAAHAELGLPRAENHWKRAARLLRPLVSRSLRRSTDLAEALDNLDNAVAKHRTSLLTHATGEPSSPVQLMGLYQTKGREADATVIVLRSNDFYGPERHEPFETGSRLLYVVLTRARYKTVVLVLGDDMPALVAPLAQLSA